MIAAWMIFALEIGALLFVSAWMAERSLLAARKPVRGVWLAAIIGSNLLPIVLSKISVTNKYADRWTLAVAPESVLMKFGTPLLLLWGLAAAIGLFVCVSGIWRMSRTRPLWKNEHVDNTPMLVSHDIGPALVGVIQYSIVVPQWAYSLEASARRLLLAHEREHARKYDPLLLAAAVLAVVAAPWNVFNWLFFRRLHLAVELDCDRRVLRAHPDARGYGALLLDVAERVLPSMMPAAAFVEHGASLETRINAMSEKTKSFRLLRATGGLTASIVIAAAACVTPRPYAIILVPQGVATQTIASPTSTMNPQSPTVPSVVSQSLEPKLESSLARHSPGVLRDPAELATVAPSTFVRTLDEMEHARLRSAVAKFEPRTLKRWPRRDSAVVMLFDANDGLAKHLVIAKPMITSGPVKDIVFPQVFMIPEIGALESAVEMSIVDDNDGKTLDIPLTVYSGRMLNGARMPLARAEVAPSENEMKAALRSSQMGLFRGDRDSAAVGVLLYNTKGQLLMTASVTPDVSPTMPDGSDNVSYSSALLEKAFGSQYDSGVIVQSAMIHAPDTARPSDGPTRMMYAIMLRHSDIAEFRQSLLKSTELSSVPHGASMSRRSNDTRASDRRIEARLAELIRTRVPEATGTWSRGDSAVVFLFDATDELVARSSSAIPRSGDINYVAALISTAVPEVQPDDVVTMGTVTFTSSTSGRRLNKPLRVIWGRLRNGVALSSEKRRK